MPNWCYTVYKCTGKKKDLKKLHDTLDKLKNKEPIAKSDFGSLWLGCVVVALGGKWEDVRCRGQITDFYLDPDGKVLTIIQETAWCEQVEFREFLESVYPGMKIYYQEEEPGNCVYYTNDSCGNFFKEKYILDYCNELENKVGYGYYVTLTQVFDEVENFIGKSLTCPRTYEGLQEYLEDFNSDDNYCNLYRYEYSE